MRFHVIIVDDEELAVEGLKVFPWESYELELAGSFTDPRSALEWCKANPVDILLADVRMPAMTGLELAAAVRDVLPDVLVILFSGHSEFAYAQEALRQSVFRYVLKPIDDEELGVALQEACATLREREQKKHWTQQLARDYWFREKLLDRRVDKDARELAAVDPDALRSEGYALFVVATGRDLPAMMSSTEGVMECTTLREGEWAILLASAFRDAFCEWLERHHLVSGVSSIHSGPSEVRHGFLEARTAVGMHFVWPERCVIRYEDIPKPDAAAVANDLAEASTLAGHLVLQEPGDCAQNVSSLVEKMVSHAATPEMIRRAAFILAVGVQGSLRESQGALTEQELAELPDLFSIEPVSKRRVFDCR